MSSPASGRVGSGGTPVAVGAAVIGVVSLVASVFVVLFAAAGSTGLLVVGAATQAGLAGLLVDGEAARWAGGTVVAQLPGMLLAIAVAVLLVGAVPRASAAAWAIVGWSAFTAMFGGLARLPRWLRGLSLFGHGPDAVTGAPTDWMPWGAVVLLVLMAAVAVTVGLGRMRRRDLLLG